MNFFLKFLLFCIFYFPVFLYLKDIRMHMGNIPISRSYLSKTINIYRDEYDIPHIEGPTLKDCFYGLGYVHAQDRLFSLSIKKFLFAGRLSEVFGQDLLEMDKYFRNLMISHSSRENLQNLDAEALELMGSYVDGLNDFANSLLFLPNEFYLAGLPFENFKIEDGITLWKFLSYILTYDWQHEIFREKLAEVFSEEMAEEMTAAFSRFHFDNTVILNDEELKQSGIYSEFSPKNRSNHTNHNFSHHTTHKYVKNVFFEIIDALDNMARGSNNWVIHGNYTKSGKPIMANDPHLDNHIPCLWYLTEMIYEQGEKYVIGATLPGLPFIFSGKTQFFSWGATTLHTDTSDLYKETLSEDGTKYLYEGEYYDMELIYEEIKVKGEKSEILVIKKTRHGPILKFIQDVYNVEYDLPNVTLSFAWTGYIKNDTTYMTLVNLYKITNNTSEIARILGGFVSPFMNIVYASATGDIGYYACGCLPIRNNPEEGFFLRGDLKENDWVGIINNTQAPQIVNPRKGYILSANNKFATDNIVYHKSIHMLPSARALRIEQMIKGFIEKGVKIGVEDVMKMQIDVLDPYAEIILPKMINLVERYYKILNMNKNDEEIVRNLIDILKKWDFQVRKESIAASIYNVWEYKFLGKLLGKIPIIEDRERLAFSLNFEQFILRKIEQWHSISNSSLSEEWCQGEEIIPVNLQNITCIYQLITALLDTNFHLQSEIGENIETWQWGVLHKKKYRHIPFSDTHLRIFFEREYPADGNRRTVNVGIPNFRTHKLDGVHSANLRLIVDMEVTEKSYFIIDTGMTENIFSQNYDGFIEKHRKGEYLEMKYGVRRVKEYEKCLILENNFEGK